MQAIRKSQLEKVKKDFTRFVDGFTDMGVSDYEYTTDNIRVFVDFDILPLNRIELKSVEVLNSDYDMLEEDTAVLKSYVRPIIKSYNDEIESETGDGYTIAEELAKERYYSKKYTI